MKIQRALHKLSLWAAAGALVLASAACSTDSPSEPSRDPGPAPGTGGGGGASYTVTVTVDPSTVAIGAQDPVVVTIRAQAPGGGSPPNGTVALVDALLGQFQSNAGLTNSIQAPLTNGSVQVLYVAPASVDDSTTTDRITASVAGNVGSATVRFAEEDVFFISSVQPASGSPQGGTVVDVLGSGFDPPVRVTFGGTPGTVVSSNATRISVRTPPSPGAGNAVTTVPVGVTINVNQEGEASDSLVNGFTYAPGGDVQQPTVLSVSPGTGPNEGGTRIVINGSGFSSPVQVEFGVGGTFVEAEVESVSPTSIVVRSPATTGFGSSLRNQSVDIRVRNLNSGLQSVLPSAFRYGTNMLISAVSPNSGPYFGGDTVTIFGQGFDAPVEINVGGVEQQVVSVTGTEVVFRTVPPVLSSCGDFSGPVQVINLDSGESATGQSYTFRVRGFEPTIFDIDPTSGDEDGGTTVTLEGENLIDPVVTLDGRPAVVTATGGGGSSVTIRTPFLPVSSFDTENCDDNADGTSGERYLPTAVDVTVTNESTTCSVTFPEGFTYIPDDQSCRNDVGPVEPTPVECEDGFDNDGDGMIDEADPECTGPGDDDESA